MPWEVVAEGRATRSSWQEISRSVDSLPVGTSARLQFNAFGIGPVFDAPGMELLVQSAFTIRGVDITVEDCWGEGFSVGVVSFHASPVAVVPLLLAIPAVLTALAWLGVAAAVLLLVFRTGGAMSGVILLVLVVAGAAVAYFAITQRKGVG